MEKIVAGWLCCILSFFLHECPWLNTFELKMNIEYAPTGYQILHFMLVLHDYNTLLLLLLPVGSMVGEL